MWLWATAGSIVTFLSLVIWRRMRRPEWQLAQLTRKLEQLSRRGNRNSSVYADIVKHICQLVRLAITKHDTVFAYKAVELLKIAAGQGGMRDGVTVQLTNLSIAAMRSGQAEIASQILDVYRLLLRNISEEDITGIMEQLLAIGVAAVRERQGFLLAKTTEIVIEKINYLNFQLPHEISSKVTLKTIQLLGLLALKRRDNDLFREICQGMTERLKLPYDKDLVKALADVAIIWLHKIVRTDDKVMYDILNILLEQIVLQEDINEEIVIKFLTELGDLAGVACINPISLLAEEIVSFMFKAIEKKRTVTYWKAVVHSVGGVATLSISRNGLEKGLLVAYPLFDAGRKMVFFSGKPGVQEPNEELAVSLSILLMNECLMLATLIARQDMTSTTGEVLSDIFQRWLTYPEYEGSYKSAKFFYQVMLLFWQKNWWRQARRGMPVDDKLCLPSLLTEMDRKRFAL